MNDGTGSPPPGPGPVAADPLDAHGRAPQRLTAADEAGGTDAGSENPKRWPGFGFLALALLVIALDLSVTDVAVPSIIADLGVSADDASLVVTVYMVVAASFMVLMGKVAYLIGARRAFLIGIVVASEPRVPGRLGKGARVLHLDGRHRIDADHPPDRCDCLPRRSVERC